jgi:TRAP transporter 4TM/12TM fusion protein
MSFPLRKGWEGEMDPFEVGTGWKLRGLRSKLALTVAVIWSLYTLSYLCHFFFYLGWVIYPITHRAISAGLVCTLVFLLYAPKKGMALEKLKWFDALPILFVIGGCTYIAINANQLVSEGRLTPYSYEMVLASFLVLSVIEATRRTIGLLFSCLIIFFFFYSIYSNYFPGFLHSTGFSYSVMFGFMYLSSEGIWGPVIGVVATIVSGFIIFGAFLRATGASHFFNDLALSTVGFTRGGPAKAAVVASTLFGTISGSIAANVATTGQITIPLMKNVGYKPNYAGAVEATASTGGMFMPPIMGATAFLIAEFLNISYWSVCVAAFLPAITYYVTLLVQVDLEAAKIGLKGLPRETLPSLRKTLAEGWQYLLPLALLIFFLGALRYSAETSIMYTIGALIIVSSFRKESRFTPKKLLIGLEDSARGMISIIPLCTAIGILVGTLSMTGVGTNLSSELLDISRGSLPILLILTAFAAFLLGMGMTAVSVYILTVVLLAPALIKAGVEPLSAHMFLFYFGCLSFITPPVCVGAYIAAGIAGGDPWKTGFRAVRLGFAAFLVPWAFVIDPNILMIGSPLEIISSFLFITLGTITMGVVFEGYFLNRLRIWETILLGISAVSIFIPTLITRGFALGFLAVFFFYHVKQSRVRKAQSAERQEMTMTGA